MCSLQHGTGFCNHWLLLFWWPAVIKTSRLAQSCVFVNMRLGKITVPVKNGMQAARVSVWHVLVVRVALVVGWAEQGGQLRMFRLPLVFAPILVPNTKAQSIYNSLFAHPAHHHVWRGLFRILDAAVVGIASYECDAATSNLKMLSHILSLAKRPHYTCHWLCSLHQLKIVETSLCGLLGASFLSRLYSVTLLF